MFTKEEAITRAQADWQNQTVRYLGIGLFSDTVPHFSAQSLFYCGSLGCDRTPEKEQYCLTYNQTIQELLAQHGVPDWSPRQRLPDRHEALQMLSDHQMIETIGSLHFQERRLVQWLAGKWKHPPLIWTRNQAKQIILIGGDHSDRCGWVDVIDLKEKTWMAHFQYRRRHVPNFPWDGAECKK